jgi:hypothetical protein
MNIIFYYILGFCIGFLSTLLLREKKFLKSLKIKEILVNFIEKIKVGLL